MRMLFANWFVNHNWNHTIPLVKLVLHIYPTWLIHSAIVDKGSSYVGLEIAMICHNLLEAIIFLLGWPQLKSLCFRTLCLAVKMICILLYIKKWLNVYHLLINIMYINVYSSPNSIIQYNSSSSAHKLFQGNYQITGWGPTQRRN